MKQPSVCAVMLTANRPEMARQAVECFRRQTYANKWLLIWDTGQNVDWYGTPDGDPEAPREGHVCADRKTAPTIGELRNEAVGFWNAFPIIIHWDSDDVSHPNRIAEQVALLQSSGADVVGYNQMLFWREPRTEVHDVSAFVQGTAIEECAYAGEAWLYSNPNPRICLGTSLCYWRTAWERRPFEARSQGEDTAWVAGLKSMGVSSIVSPFQELRMPGTAEVRMIARIHSGNTSTAYRPDLMRAIERQGGEWKRVSEWDGHCRAAMEGK